MTLAAPRPQAIVVFGASGDLSRRKILPALYDLSVRGLLPERTMIVGFATSKWDDDAFRAHARASVEEFSRTGVDEAAWKPFADSLAYVSGSFEDPEAMHALARRLDEADREFGCEGCRLYYLAVPPQAFLTIVRGLAAIGGNTPTSRIVFEKPFGDSLEGARELTEQVHQVFDESQVFRIDHYLGKETVQNLVVFRFANSLFERVWNRDAISHVQLTVAESIGLEGRAGYYDRAGAIRDLLQNHMLQVLSFAAMEPPRSLAAEAFRDEKVKLLRTIRPLDPAEVVRGQYQGYRDEPGVDPDSQTETFVAARVWIDNWRWEGVPFSLRHGKRLPERNTEITVSFRQAPTYLFEELGIGRLASDHLTIRIQPNEGISLAFQAKVPGPGYELRTVRMDFDYDDTFPGDKPAEAYERLLHDAMDGDHTLFTRADGVERSWEIVAPALEHPSPLCTYAPGTWGPVEAEELIAPHRWHLRDHGGE
jgi:glucose-6-phosphate 1-dehydrogenase